MSFLGFLLFVGFTYLQYKENNLPLTFIIYGCIAVLLFVDETLGCLLFLLVFGLIGWNSRGMGGDLGSHDIDADD